MENPLMRVRLAHRLFYDAFAVAVILAVTPGGGALAATLGQSCGGRLGIGCDRGLFCDLRAGTCGNRDAEGACAHIPTFCLRRIFRTVCGCDGQTYTNNCQRARAIVSKRHDGHCR